MTWTINKILEWTTDYLKKYNTEWPHLEGEILLAHTLGVKRIELYVQHERILSEKELAKYKALILRRSKHEPIAYIVGNQPFMSLELEVTPDVLIPRPETEKLVEIALEEAKNLKGTVKIADIGTGSGAIAVTLAKYIPNCEVTAIEISEKALEIARKNAEKFGVANKITFLKGNFLAPLANRKFDMIVSNPPYIASAQIKTLMPDVRDFEPTGALDGGEDGLKYIKQLLEQAPALLSDKGYLIIEIGEDQKAKTLAAAQNFSNPKVLKDQFEKDRVFIARYS
ncbi:MAG: peptide chain release factor N(5)-glutamine methyltransferase [Candidatus Margulisbacteria bacterium]|nr:peptide chain release factor N(5)-glutamine methyltransferase [Candidatus Margulisiibacteriota bacterium]MBU1022216.1 peptide chain release factor N(5)-glutamine methyltransferase [Candidatus Margulisiibacteriota bacterium]MBU1729345.1 peptide chain release factor N(5)-glutamine methyltransferase [Candidatus Margulisiibacteriota bacterium]MBU1955618.1 peptide chain release factor N(5)-glutamine methyltransferase [Candidatus Margulisiibacteriota bacterium]